MSIDSKVVLAKNFVTSKAGRTLLVGRKHSPVILFGAGVVGVVATAVMASKATLQLDQILYDNEKKMEEAKELLRTQPDRYTAKDFTKDSAYLKARLIKDVGRLYAPSVAIGIMSVGCLTGSHVVLTRRNASLVAAYAALDKGFNEYRARVIEQIGPEEEKKLLLGTEIREITVDTDKGPQTKSITTASPYGASPYARFFSKENVGSLWSPDPGYNLVTLRAQQQYANSKLQARGHVFLNEIYDSLGFDRTSAGAVVGWVWNNKKGGDNYIDFGIFTDENQNSFSDFMSGREDGIWLDFNVDGVVYDLI